MAKQKDKLPNEKLGKISVAGNPIQSLPPETADIKCKEFDCSDTLLDNLGYAPGLVTGDIICRNIKKPSGELNRFTQYHLGAGRFGSFEGPEDEDINRPVKVDGSFITDSNVYKSPKMYDIKVGVEAVEDVDAEIEESNDISGVVQLAKGYQMFVGIKNPILAFEQEQSEVSPGIFVDYSKRSRNAPYHADFKVRQGLTGGTTDYCGIRPSIYGKTKWDGWGEPPFNFNGYVNWSFFNCYNGKGSGQEDGIKGNHIGWGKWAIIGTTILNGKPLGAKTDSMKNRPVYYYVNGDPKMYRLRGKEIYYAKPYTTGISFDEKGIPSYKDAAYKANFFDNIRIAIPVAGGPHIENDKLTGNASYNDGPFPFFGKLSNNTYFAGYGSAMTNAAKLVKKYFNDKGLKVEWMDNGDGGGSTQLYARGKSIKSSGRQIPSVIGWNE